MLIMAHPAAAKPKKGGGGGGNTCKVTADTDVAIYAASLEEWAANPENPMHTFLDLETDEE